MQLLETISLYLEMKYLYIGSGLNRDKELVGGTSPMVKSFR